MANARFDGPELSAALHRLSYLLQRLNDNELLPELGVSYAQYRVMAGLRQRPVSEQRHLAAHLHQTEAGISRSLKQLGSQGLIRTERDRRDNRRRRVSLTPEGAAVLSRADEITAELSNQLFRSFSPSEAGALGRLLAKLLQSLMP